MYRLAVTSAALAASVVSGQAMGTSGKEMDGATSEKFEPVVQPRRLNTQTCQNPSLFNCDADANDFNDFTTVAVSCGNYACVARKTDGTAEAWGLASHGGDASSATLTDVADISCGGSACVARKTDGTAEAWGNPSLGGDAGTSLGSCADQTNGCTANDCCTVVTATKKCSTVASQGTDGSDVCGAGMIYDTTKVNDDCASSPCVAGGSDVTACCKLDAVPDKCSTVATSPADFCGVGKVYDDTKATTDCVATTCSKDTAIDVTACCKPVATDKSASSVLSPSSAAEKAAKKKEASRLEKVRAAAAKVVAENTTATVLGILFAVLVLFACCLFATRNHDKKKPNGSTPSAENSNDLEQPKAVVELTANPMKQAK
jgi:hypothetical protein